MPASSRPTLFVLLLLTASLAGAAPVTAATDGSTVAASTTRTETVPVDVTVRRTGDPETVQVVYEYDVPFDVNVWFEVPKERAANVTIVSTSGLARSHDTEYRYETSGGDASITANVTLSTDRNASWPIAVSRDGYAFVNLPAFFAAWSGADTVYPTYDLHVRGEGFGSMPLVYYGNYTHAVSEDPHQTIHVVVPANASAAVDETATVRALSNVSRYVPNDDPTPVVAGFLVPDDLRVDNGGLTVSSNAFWVASTAHDSSYGTWVHEYVHTSQDDFGPQMQWFVEASADYYSYLVPLSEGRLSFSAARSGVVYASSDDAVLADKSTWPSEAVPYARGSRVLMALNVRVQNATDGRASFTDVYRRLEHENQAVSLADFEDAIAAYLGEEQAARFVDRYVAGAANVSVPSEPYPYALVPDSDGDGLTVDRERALGTSPFAADTDGDTLSDAREADLGTDPTRRDTDDDGVPDDTELEAGLDPLAADTDGDGVHDGTERRQDWNPLAADTDGDGLSDGREVALKSDPAVADTDGDGLSDRREVKLGTNPAATDSDLDGWTDRYEVRQSNTDPTAADTDGDGSPDRNDAFPRNPGRTYRLPTIGSAVVGVVLLAVSGLGFALVASARVTHRVVSVASSGVADRIVPRIVRQRSLTRLVLLGVLGVLGVGGAIVFDAFVWPPS